ncbi:hypothetical protein TBLA_0B07570 [Henningerozyma blattae CBS 6284]|uniref:Multivesicular body sorting factor 12 domain-containing protein n=1 Tax=Henningerozyma blattae (strain ATCC 34711 / CBS 6284 / DSM 70876 / NBRC 10599 / NRRL Y-10934 / UCD 77-7) TaxID=1071380 RepID=I2GZM2_HENB6|nr:hypothetical protein TBLA_0B07570 [Tetrapisispora blattae CBS 6284]CCH59574.1 hypothetical protein TBLA_0B07570 [Tetrapisispora blattae CBS 6284]
MGQINTENLLRQLPLINSKGVGFPQESVVSKLNEGQTQTQGQIQTLNLNRSVNTKEMFEPWYKECDELKNRLEKDIREGETFHDWYKEKYLNKIPPGLLDGQMNVLSPSKK